MEENLSGKQQENVGQKPKKGFSVTFEDGTVIYSSRSVDTFVESLKKIGLERINESPCPEHAGYKVVDTREKLGKIPTQKKVTGYFIFTAMRDKEKIDDLNKISSLLGLNLKIEKYNPSKAPKTRLRVTFLDGTVIEEKKACETFKEAILHIGLNRVRNLNCGYYNAPIVTDSMDGRYDKEKIKVPGGLYVNPHGSTQEKIDMLYDIAGRLDDVELIAESVPLKVND